MRHASLVSGNFIIALYKKTGGKRKKNLVIAKMFDEKRGGFENGSTVVKVVCHWGLFKRSKKHEEEKKTIGEETRLIKVAFKEADILERLNRNYQA